MIPSPSQNAFDMIRDSEEAESFRVRFLPWPKQWDNFSAVTLNWHHKKFDFNDSSLTQGDKIGVYAFVVEPRITAPLPCAFVFYVGQTGSKLNPKTHRDFETRYGEYLNEYFRKKKPRLNVVKMLRKWGDHLYYYYAEVPQADIKKTEDALIAAFMPPANDVLPAGVREIIGAF